MDGRPWSGLAGRPDGGSEWTRPSGSALDDLLDGLARDRTRWATAGRQGTAPATFFGRERTRFTSAPGPGSRPRFERGHPANPHGPSIKAIVPRRPTYRRTPTALLRKDPRTGPPTITATDSSVVGQWQGERPESSRGRGATLGWQVGHARHRDRKDGPGI